MVKYILYLFVTVCFFASCSTTEYAQSAISLKGKRVGIIGFDMTAIKKKQQLNPKDTICFCIGQSISDAVIPSLLKAGLIILPISHDKKVSLEENIAIADSLKLEYLLIGNGRVSIIGQSNFIEQLNVKMINVKSRESHMAASFSGVSIRPIKAGTLVGKKIAKSLK